VTWSVCICRADGEDSDSDDFDYLDAAGDEDRLKACMMANKKGATVEIQGETSSSYLELVSFKSKNH
jgi:hypothetical protein